MSLERRIRFPTEFGDILERHWPRSANWGRSRKQKEVLRMKKTMKIQVRKAGPVRLTAAACSYYTVKN
jgi:hypothetical protein